MNTFVELFTAQRDHFSQQLHRDPRPEFVLREVRELLSLLFTAYGAEKERNLTERRLAGFLIDLIKSALTVLVTNEAVAAPTAPVVSTSSVPIRGPRPLFVKLIKGALFLALFASLLQAEAYLSLLLLFVLLIFDLNDWFTYRSPQLPAVASTTVTPVTQVNITAFLSRLSEALNIADHILADVAQPPGSAQSAVAADAAVLELFQDLLRALTANDGTFALKQVQALPFLLEQQEIRVEQYRPETAHLFDLVPDLADGGRPARTLRPALVRKDGRLLKRGLATEPA